MAGEDASVKIGADVSDVKAAAGEAKKVWKDFSSDIVSSIGGAARAVASELSNVALAQGKINFSSQHQQVREFEAATARLAVATHSSLEGMRQEYEATGLAIGKRPQEVANWSSEVGRLTYNVKGAADGLRGVAGLAAMTGRSTEDYRGLAVQLGAVGKVSGDTTAAIGTLVAQAEQMGTTGGPAAFIDQVQGMGESFSHFTRNTTADYLKLTALQAELGHGLEPQAAQRVAAGAFAAISGDPMRWSRYLHRDILNKDTGQVDDPTRVLREIAERAKKQFGSNALRVLRLNFGSEVGTRLYNADYGRAAEAAGITPSAKPQEALKSYLQTDAGQRDRAQAELAKSSRELFGSATALGRAADALQQFAAGHPVGSTLATGVAGGVMGTVTSLAGKSVVEAVKAGGVKGAIGAAAGGVPGLAIAGAGLAGLGVGALFGYGLLAAHDVYDTHKLKGEDEKIASLKAQRDRVRAARTSLGIAASVGLVQFPGAEAIAGAQNQGAQLEEAVARAVAAALRNMTIINATGGPVEVTTGAGNSAASGHQGKR